MWSAVIPLRAKTFRVSTTSRAWRAITVAAKVFRLRANIDVVMTKYRKARYGELPHTRLRPRIAAARPPAKPAKTLRMVHDRG
jgi:hypothetical protein